MPLGILQIAACQEEKGWEPQVVDLAGTKDYVKVALDAVSGDDWSAIGFSTTTQQTCKLTPVYEAIRREYNGGLHLVAGGPGPTMDPETYLGMGFDKVVKGEGELAWDAWEKGGPRLVSPPLIEDLSTLPLPARHLLDPASYRFRLHDGTRALHIVSSRGCPMSCGFCSGRDYPYYRRFRPLGVERTVREILEIRDRWGFQGITDYADEINISKAYLMPLCDALAPLGLKLRGFCIARLLDDVQMAAIKRAGFVEICIGAESGSNQVLAASKINKTTYETTVRAAHLAHKHGVRIKTFTMVGLPGETLEDVLMTRRMLLEARPDDFDLTIHTPMPGSPIYEHPERFSGLGFTKIDFREDAPFYKGVPGEYQSYVETQMIRRQEFVALRDLIDRDVRRQLDLPEVRRPSYQDQVEHSMGQMGA